MNKRKRLGTILGFAGFIIAVIGVIIWFRQVDMVAIPGDRTLFVATFVIALVMGIATFVIGTRWFGGIAAALTILIGLFMPFTVAISPQKVAENAIRVGDTIPAFSALNDEGGRFNSKTLNGRPTLIKFFRGHW